LLAIKQNTTFEIEHSPGRISIIFIFALVVPHACANDRKKKGLAPLNWFIGLVIAFGILLLGLLAIHLIAPLF
jgi:hypothetical protein